MSQRIQQIQVEEIRQKNSSVGAEVEHPSRLFKTLSYSQSMSDIAMKRHSYAKGPEVKYEENSKNNDETNEDSKCCVIF